MKYHTLFFQKLGNVSKNLLSAAVVIGALMAKTCLHRVRGTFQRIHAQTLNEEKVVFFENSICLASEDKMNIFTL